MVERASRDKPATVAAGRIDAATRLALPWRMSRARHAQHANSGLPSRWNAGAAFQTYHISFVDARLSLSTDLSESGTIGSNNTIRRRDQERAFGKEEDAMKPVVWSPLLPCVFLSIAVESGAQTLVGALAVDARQGDQWGWAVDYETAALVSGDMLCGAPDYAELGSAARADPGICLERYSA